MCKPRLLSGCFIFYATLAREIKQKFFILKKEAKSMEEVVRLLMEELVKRGVTPEQVKEGLRHEVVVEHVARWLMNPPQEFPCL